MSQRKKQPESEHQMNLEALEAEGIALHIDELLDLELEGTLSILVVEEDKGNMKEVVEVPKEPVPQNTCQVELDHQHCTAGRGRHQWDDSEEDMLA